MFNVYLNIMVVIKNINIFIDTNNIVFKNILVFVLILVYKLIINIIIELIIIIITLLVSTFSKFNNVSNSGVMRVEIINMVNDFNKLKKVFIISPNKYYSLNIIL